MKTENSIIIKKTNGFFKLSQLFFVLFFYVYSGVINLANAEENPTQKSEPLVGLESFVDGLMNSQLKNNHIAGGTIAIVKDGKVLLSKGYGYADIENNIPVSGDDTLFRPGSTSKLFTYTAVMQLVEQGKLDLNADVNDYLTKFKIPSTFEEPIKVIDLLTHTGGFEERFINLIAFDSENALSIAEFLPDNIPERVMPVGQNSSYSNYSVALAGHLVEIVSGLSFEDYLQKNIFKPLGMHSTTFLEPLPSHLQKNMSDGHTYDKGTFTYKKERFEMIHGQAPAGASSSTAGDMAKFMLAHLNKGSLDGVSILKAETAEKMHSAVYSKGYGGHSMAHGFYQTSYKGLDMIGHAGDLLYFHSNLYMLPEHDFGIFMSFNTADVGDTRPTVITSILDQYFVKDHQKSKSPEGFSEQAHKYSGEFKFLRHSSSDFTKSLGLAGGNLQIFPGEDNTLIISPMGGKYAQVNDNLFVSVDNPVPDFSKVTFHLDENGFADEVYLLPFMHARKLSWMEKPSTHQILLGISLIAFISMLISAFRQRKNQKLLPKQQVMLPKSLTILSAINVIFIIVFAIGVTVNMKSLFSTTSSAFILMPISFSILFLSVAMTIPVLYATYNSWANGYWNTKRRVSYSLITLLSVVFLLLMNYYNLIGFNY
ncbi:MAG: CubicO group peptidase (beta-lactamase class C family) [Alteromonadaceae bacterium]|jgi:CubicO group peptidase (beta-lactamase class C family)